MGKINDNIKHQLLEGIWPLFEDKEDCYKSVKIKGIFHNHYVELENHNDKYKNLSLAQYLNENRRYFKEIINDNFFASNDA